MRLRLALLRSSTPRGRQMPKRSGNARELLAANAGVVGQTRPHMPRGRLAPLRVACASWVFRPEDPPAVSDGLKTLQHVVPRCSTSANDDNSKREPAEQCAAPRMCRLLRYYCNDEPGTPGHQDMTCIHGHRMPCQHLAALEESRAGTGCPTPTSARVHLSVRGSFVVPATCSPNSQCCMCGKLAATMCP